MAKILRLTEADLRNIIRESVKRTLKEAESGGWVVDASEAEEAYNMAAAEFGNEELNAAIVRCMGNETLAQCLAYIFRQYDFRQWQSRFDDSTIGESIDKTIEEDAGAGATNAAGVMQGGGTNPEAGQYTVPFGKVQRRKIYQPKDEKTGGDVTKQSSNVDMSPAMKRKNGKGGSISIPKHRV